MLLSHKLSSANKLSLEALPNPEPYANPNPHQVLLPLALWGQLGESWNHWATIPAEFIISFFLFGIEEVR